MSVWTPTWNWSSTANAGEPGGINLWPDQRYRDLICGRGNPSPFSVCCHALLGQGRNDLAALLDINSAGQPCFDRCRGLPRSDALTIYQAATVAYRSMALRQPGRYAVAESYEDGCRLLDSDPDLVIWVANRPFEWIEDHG